MDNFAWFFKVKGHKTLLFCKTHRGYFKYVAAKAELTTLKKTTTLRSRASTCHVHSRKTVVKLSLTGPLAGCSTGTANLIGSYYMCSSCDIIYVK